MGLYAQGLNKVGAGGVSFIPPVSGPLVICRNFVNPLKAEEIIFLTLRNHQNIQRVFSLIFYLICR